MEDDILYTISKVNIDCPDCEWVEDDQYQCTTCGFQGGHGRLNVLDYLRENRHLL